jgi:predicted DNA-binding ribbon-helix-helix protein
MPSQERKKSLIGRPPGRNGKKRTIYVPDKEWSKLTKVAFAQNISASQLIRRVAAQAHIFSFEDLTLK